MYLVLSYLLQSKHDLKDKSQLLVLIRKFPEGIAVIDLKDSYPTVMDDLQVTLVIEISSDAREMGLCVQNSTCVKDKKRHLSC